MSLQGGSSARGAGRLAVFLREEDFAQAEDGAVDGINDTAALAAADVSLAPGTALDAARNAADVVLLRRSFDDLPMLFRIAKATVKLSKQNFVIASFYNVLAVPLAVAGFATPLLAALAMSASSITVLLNALRINLVR